VPAGFRAFASPYQTGFIRFATQPDLPLSGRVRTRSSSAPEENTIALSRNIALKLKETFKHDILVIVRSVKELRELDARQPFKDVEITPQTKLFVTFISENRKHREISSSSQHDGFQILQISDDTICSVLDYRPGIDAVLLMSTIEKEFGKKATTRSWNTVTRLLKIYGKN